MAPTLSYVALIAGVLLAVLLATISLLFSFLRGIRSRASLPYRAIPVVFPPIPVEWTPGVLLVGILTLLWGAGHVAAAISWLVIDGWSAAGKAQSQGMIIWVSVSGLLVALGGAALLARQPAGRKMMSWGFILLLLVAAIMAVMALLVPEFEEMSRKAQRQSRLLALLMTATFLSIRRWERWVSASGDLTDSMRTPRPPKSRPLAKPPRPKAWPRSIRGMRDPAGRCIDFRVSKP
jgi:hypothetical protein